MIVAGFGFREGASLPSLRAALAAAQAHAPPVSALATLTDKSTTLAPLATALGLPLIAVPAGALNGVETATRSAASLAKRRTGSVAEATALAAAGPGARLVAPRTISADRMATCAIAIRSQT